MRTQDLGLTILGSYLRPPRRLAWSGGMVKVLEDLGYSPPAARAALARLADRGLVSRVKSGRQVYYELTPRAGRLLEQGDRRIFSFGRTRPSSDLWTVLWHSIPEQSRTERSRLGAGLRFLGFGSVQDATWVAASDRQDELLDLLRELDVEPHAAVFAGRLNLGLPIDSLLAAAWDLKALRKAYRAFIAEFERFQGKRDSLSDAEAFRIRTRLLHAFRTFPFLDPELPAGLVAPDGLRPRALEIFDEVYESLGAQADRYFGEVVGSEARAPTAART